MNLAEQLRRRRTWLIAVPILVVVLGLLGPFVYFNVIRDDPPPPLSFADVATTTTTAVTVAAGGDATSTTAVLGVTATTRKRGATTATSAAPAASPVEGPWHVGAGSLAGYRVEETVGVSSGEAVGRTPKVTGAMRIRGTSVVSGSWTVDMASVTSDSEMRDGQYRSNMAVDQYPTSMFVLGSPIAFGSVPPDGTDVAVAVKGALTLRGKTRPVEFGLQARRKNNRIEVVGNIPVKFEDYEIPNPSNGYARTADHGLVEFLLLFERG